MSDVTVTSHANLQNEVRYGDQTFITDEPSEAGGEDAAARVTSLDRVT